jgi:hypothetical protein
MEKLANKVLMVDLSPLFEDLPADFSQPLKIPVDDFGITRDDIYTLQNILYYNGTERPSCEEDSFNAP